MLQNRSISRFARCIGLLSKSRNISIVHRNAFSTNVWGARTLEWIDEQITSHIADHEGDYEDLTVTYSMKPGAVGRQRKAIVTPCVQQATSAYLLDSLLKQEYAVRGIAVPESEEKFIEGRFQMKNAKVTDSKDTFEGKEISVQVIEEGDLKIERRVIESFTLDPSDLQTYDVVFDEMPLLRIYDKVENAKAPTTVLGHGLRKGGLLYLQCEGAKDRKQKLALIQNIQSFYPDTHFDLIESRRTPWTRQFLFLKVDDTL